MATELEEPWKPLVAMILYGGVTILMSTMSKKFPRMRKYLNGTPTILMDHGKLYRENLSKAKLDLSEFMVMCRQQGYFDLSNIQTAIFEYNGILTILPVSSQRPATPNDMSLNPQQELLFTELIMDGRILEGNLKRMGLDLTWLNRQLSERNIHSPREVFLAVCDRNLKLVLFKNIQNERGGRRPGRITGAGPPAFAFSLPQGRGEWNPRCFRRIKPCGFRGGARLRQRESSVMAARGLLTRLYGSSVTRGPDFPYEGLYLSAAPYRPATHFGLLRLCACAGRIAAKRL